MSRLFTAASSHYLLDSSPPWAAAAPLTFATWFASVDNNALGTLMALATSTQASNHVIRLGVDTQFDVVVASYRATTNVNATASTGTTDALWHHAAAVFESSTSRTAYFDGVGGTANTTSSSPSGMNRFAIGVRPSSTFNEYFNGYIAHSAAWSVALTADEIAMLGAGRVSPLMIRPQSLVFYTPYLGRDSADIDIIGGRSLTVSGATSSAEEPPLLWLPGRKKIFLPATAAAISVISGSSALTITPSAPLVGSGQLAGAVPMTLTPTGTVQGNGSLAGNASEQFGAGSSTLNGTANMAGVSPMTFTPAATAQSSGAMAGNCDIIITPTGTLTPPSGAMQGIAAMTITLAAVLSGAGSLSGVAAMVLDAIGTFTSSAVSATRQRFRDARRRGWVMLTGGRG